MHIFKQWLYSLKHYSKMMIFMSSPSNLPYCPSCLLFSLMAYIACGKLLMGETRSLIMITTQIIIELFILYLISSVILKVVHKTERLQQTVSALIGVSLVISFVSLPIMAILPDIRDGDTINALTVQVSLVILIWNLAVISLIFKKAFEIRTILAGFLSFNYFLLYQFLIVNFL